jgi:GNAT superfamily N-acetyltransferase
MPVTPPTRYKRLRMEVDLRRVEVISPVLPDGYRWVPWRSILCERHAQVKWRSFREDLDGQVFPCLSQIQGCRKLITDIQSQSSFSLNATWMVAFQPEPAWPADDCGTIQGISRHGTTGAIQNVGIVPEHRGLGLGRAIVQKALEGFWHDGLNIASLEVTADNQVAVELYHSLGFRVTRVLYREAAGGKIVAGTERDPGRLEVRLTSSS